MRTGEPTARQIHAAARRKAARELERAEAAKTAARIAVHVARIRRKHPEVDADTAGRAAQRLDSDRHNRPGDRLRVRLDPRNRIEPYKTWRADHKRRCAYLEIAGWWEDGLPLAHEGGHPFHCADRVTAELARANGHAWLAEQAWGLRASC
jgi:hypothetical protein